MSRVKPTHHGQLTPVAAWTADNSTKSIQNALIATVMLPSGASYQLDKEEEVFQTLEQLVGPLPVLTRRSPTQRSAACAESQLQ